MNKIIAVYGAGGHGKVVADIAVSEGYDKVIFIDDGENEHLSFNSFVEVYGKNIPIALGIGENRIREKVYFRLIENEYKIATLIHPSAIISDTVSVKEGTVVMAGAIINTGAVVGFGGIVNSGAVVEHECQLDDFVHISPNVALGGNVCVGKLTHVGIGSSIIQNIHIENNCIIGAGSVVLNKIEANSVAVGVPAKVIKKKDG